MHLKKYSHVHCTSFACSKKCIVPQPRSRGRSKPRRPKIYHPAHQAQHPAGDADTRQSYTATPCTSMAVTKICVARAQSCGRSISVSSFCERARYFCTTTWTVSHGQSTTRLRCSDECNGTLFRAAKSLASSLQGGGSRGSYNSLVFVCYPAGDLATDTFRLYYGARKSRSMCHSEWFATMRPPAEHHSRGTLRAGSLHVSRRTQFVRKAPASVPRQICF